MNSAQIVPKKRAGAKAHYAVLGLMIALAIYLRLFGLGSQSLWADEFCTWHVSRMPLGESLQWGPELTKPPLYQLALRLLTDDPHPPEWVLRLPAAVAGILLIPVGYWLGSLGGGPKIGLCLAGLLAVQPFNIVHSQDARPYTMLALGCAVSSGLWYRLVSSPRFAYLILYVICATLTFHAHYLTVLTLAAHACWFAAVYFTKRAEGSARFPLLALGVTMLLCVPMTWHFLRSSVSTFQGLDWIHPPTILNAIAILGQISFGYAWIAAVFISCIVIGIVAWLRRKRPTGNDASIYVVPSGYAGLLVMWLLFSWFGLLVISWLKHPVMVDRYAIPATVPALLLPLIVSRRLFSKGPLILWAIFMIVGIVTWIGEHRMAEPGFRELVQFLEEGVHPERDAVVLTIDHSLNDEWEDAQRLPFAYYPPSKRMPLREIHMRPDGVTVENPAVLQDPHMLWIIVFQTDPFRVLAQYNRQPALIEIEGERFTQLRFDAYRLVCVAPSEARP